MLAVEGSQVTIRLAFACEMSLAVLVWADIHQRARAVPLLQQEEQTSSGRAARAVRVVGSRVRVSVVNLGVKRLR